MKEKETGTMEALGENSQVRRLQGIVRQTNISLLAGGILLVLLFIASAGYIRASQNQLEISLYLNQYRMGSKALTTAVRSYAVTGDVNYYDDYMRELTIDKNRDTALEGLQGDKLRSEEWQELTAIAEISNNLVPLEENAMEAVQAGDTAAAIEFVFGAEYKDAVEEINAMTDETISDILGRLDSSKRLYLIILLVCAAMFVIGFVRLALQSRKTIRFSKDELLTPIIKVSEQMRTLADGNLHAELDLVADDSEVGRMVSAIAFMKNNLADIIEEISLVLEQMGQGNFNVAVSCDYVGEYVQIKDSLNTIVEEMRGTVRSLKQVTDMIDSGAGQLANAADDLANSCTGQAGQVSDLVTLLSELSESIAYNEKEAEEAVKIAALSSSTLTEGSQKMTNLKEAMNAICTGTDKIVEVMSAIADIGDEIDMLSLNASIESARAGEMGKGFAVVAEQVKKLAEESQDAVGQTAGLIKTMLDAVALVTSVIDETISSMEDIQVGSEEMTGRLNSIVDKLTIEVTDIEQINNAIDVVAGIVDNNSAISEETAAVSQEQKTTVQTMVELMDRFRV
ncbi:MAG: methyl-accepting chemotaxis protein [Roseburia sp.]|nr:methyl-accepting chemotaxis protein [Roseburia sp.]